MIKATKSINILAILFIFLQTVLSLYGAQTALSLPNFDSAMAMVLSHDATYLFAKSRDCTLAANVQGLYTFNSINHTITKAGNSPNATIANCIDGYY